MWYAIIAGVFLAVGLGLLIWGLVERKKRYEAELRLKDAQQTTQDRGKQIDVLRQQLRARSDELLMAQRQTDVVRTLLEVTRAKLLLCNDPRVVKLWLDNEMNDKDI